MSRRDDVLSGLNEAQYEAASVIDGPCLVVAGAGSGKTTVLSRRVAALTSLGIDPSSILLLTFTRVAARNMIDRAQRLDPLAADVVGGTFHSIANKLIAENHALFRLPEKPSILDPEDVRSAFRKIIAKRGGTDQNLPSASNVAKAHSLAVNTMSDLADVMYDRMQQFTHAIDFTKECVEDYVAYKRERGLLDYDDLLVAWNRMMEHPKVSSAVRDRFRYVMIDEHQDSNAIQCSIVEKLGDNVMAVGDPAQSIYGFRGSAPRTMFAFKERWPHARIVNLEVNYRSTEQILDLANFVDRSMCDRFDRQLRPVPGESGPLPVIVTVPAMEEEARFIAEQILRRKADGVELHEQAVLVRSMHTARYIEAELERRRIPYTVMGGIKISDAAHVKDVVCLARTVVNVLDEPAWIRVLTMAKGVGDKKASDTYRKMIGERAVSPAEAMSALVAKHPQVEAIIEARRILESGTIPVASLERAIRLLDGILSQRYDDWNGRRPDLDAVLSMAEGHETLDQFLSSIVIDHSIDKKSRATASDEERPLTISTIHSAKGLEWEVCYIPQFVDGHMPSFMSKSSEELEEEKRVFYVAVTRPKRELIIVKPTIGLRGMLSTQSGFERVISDCVEFTRVGKERQAVGFNLGVEAEIDCW